MQARTSGGEPLPRSPRACSATAPLLLDAQSFLLVVGRLPSFVSKDREGEGKGDFYRTKVNRIQKGGRLVCEISFWWRSGKDQNVLLVMLLLYSVTLSSSRPPGSLEAWGCC